MSKIFWQVASSLDGFMEEPGGDLGHTAMVTDEEFERYADEMLGSIGAMLLGRRTYEVFLSYWPTATGYQAERMNAIPKYVFSRTLEGVKWENTTLVNDANRESIEKIRKSTDADIAVFGSSDLASSLISLGVIDEYRILISRFVVGRGTRSFGNIDSLVSLRLDRVETGSSGLVSLYYVPAG